MKYVSIILLTLLLGGCAAGWSALLPSSDPLVSADVGDKEANVAGEVNKDETNVEGGDVEVENNQGSVESVNAKDVYQEVGEVNNSEAGQAFDSVQSVDINNMPLSYLLLMILGWILPSPGAIYAEIKKGLKILFKVK